MEVSKRQHQVVLVNNLGLDFARDNFFKESAAHGWRCVRSRNDQRAFAGGKIALDEAGTAAALARVIGEPLGLEGQWAAAGIAEIVEENMANAARVHAIERGKDIAQCSMIAFGGGAPLHACRFAEKVGINHIIVPKGAGVGSAIGFLQAPLAYEITRSAIIPLEGFDAARVNALLQAMVRDATAVVAPAIGKETPIVRIVADARYVGQGHEIQIAVPIRVLTNKDGAALTSAFEKAYGQVYGLTIPGQEAEITTWSVTVSSRTKAPSPVAKARKQKAPKPLRIRKVYDASAGKALPTPVYWRFDLAPGTMLKGPAIIAEHETSTIVTCNFIARIDSAGYIHLERVP